jgi:hypothetical protein
MSNTLIDMEYNKTTSKNKTRGKKRKLKRFEMFFLPIREVTIFCQSGKTIDGDKETRDKREIQRYTPIKITGT